MKKNNKKTSPTERRYPKFPPKELATLWRVPIFEEIEPSQINIVLRERIKELNCLYGISKLALRHPDSLDDLLEEVVDFLPYSWQFPEITCVRITCKGKSYESKGFKTSRWRLSSPIYIYNEHVGEVEVFYTKEAPPADEGPFLKEERALIDAIAEQIGHYATRIFAEKELEEINRQLMVERKALQEANLAMRTILARIEDEKREIYKDINNNIEKIIMPILHAMALEVPLPQRKYVELLKSSLEEITSPFVTKLSKSFQSLTPCELEICNMIKRGLRTKEIAKIKGIAEGTVNRHRENIRRKLQLKNKDANLATYLQTFWEG